MNHFVAQILVVAVCLASTPLAKAQSEMVTMSLDVESERRAETIDQEALKCLKDNTCKAVVDAVFAYFGMDSSTATAAVAQIKKSDDGAISKFDLILPNGYEYCRSQVEPRSVRPSDSQYWVQRLPNGLWIQTRTTIHRVFDGRSSAVRLNVAVVGVRSDLAASYRQSGQCRPNDTKLIYSCQGKHCATVKD